MQTNKIKLDLKVTNNIEEAQPQNVKSQKRHNQQQKIIEQKQKEQINPQTTNKVASIIGINYYRSQQQYQKKVSQQQICNNQSQVNENGKFWQQSQQIKQQKQKDSSLQVIKKTKTIIKPPHISQNNRKVRLYIQNFQPYLPSFLDEINKQHLSNIIRIGQQYQVTNIPLQPLYTSAYRNMSHMRIYNGNQEKFSQAALKKYRELYGEHKTQEDLIFIKQKLQIQNWNDLVNQLVIQKSVNKRTKQPLINHAAKLKQSNLALTKLIKTTLNSNTNLKKKQLQLTSNSQNKKKQMQLVSNYQNKNKQALPISHSEKQKAFQN